MKNRIKKLRKALDLTQAAFADRIGMKQNTIATYEMGRAIPSDPTINNICKEFGVSERWLKDGRGEMFVPSASNVLDALAAEHNLTHGDYILIEKFLRMKPESRQAIVDYVIEVASAISSDDIPATSPAYPSRLNIDAEVASYRAELELQEKVADELSASDGVSATG